MKNETTKREWMEYPEPDERKIGIKVSWYTYLNEADAYKCSEAAENNAHIQAAKGYDFGYCYPSHIETTDIDGEMAYKVTLP